MGTPLDPVGWALLAVTVASTGVQMYSTAAQGAQAQGQYDAEARAHELEAKQHDLRAHQIAAARMQELNANLGAIAAARAGKNLMGDSPTGAAISKSFTRASLGAKANEVMEARLGKMSALNAMYAARSSARGARTAGYLGMASDGLNGLMDIYGLIPKSGGS